MMRVKRNVILIFLIAYAAWPLAHYWTVHALDLNPWKFFGWAMYCEPPRTIDVLPFGIEDGRRVRLISTSGLDERSRTEIRRAYDRFIARRLQLNAFVEPDEFARAILRSFPQESEIEIEIRRHVIDPQTDRVKTIIEERIYRYPREQFDR